MQNALFVRELNRKNTIFKCGFRAFDFRAFIVGLFCLRGRGLRIHKKHCGFSNRFILPMAQFNHQMNLPEELFCLCLGIFHC